MATVAKTAMLALIFGAAVIGAVQGFKCKVGGQGLTWKFVPGRDVSFYGIPTEQECREMCSEKSECKGYSWRFDNVAGWCYEFAELEGIHVCEDCFSGSLPTRFSGICDTLPDNIIDELLTSSAEDCHQACIAAAGCMGYTWWDTTTVLENYCFLYTECSEVKSCAGCSGGSMNCFSPLQCFDYLILDSKKRNENYPGAYECDTTQRPDGISEDWNGPGYYRFLPPAGIGMATKNPEPHHCGTNGVVYMADEGSNAMDNMEIGEETEVKVCNDVDFLDGTCDFEIYVKVTKCPDNYFVYKLHDLGCSQKYCGSLEP